MADHGEVFTPPWLVGAMLDLVGLETERIDARFLEPACGSGNFVVEVLRRKLAVVEARFRTSDFEKRHYALFSLMCIYGIELLDDNVSECRDKMVATLTGYLGLASNDRVCRAAARVAEDNIVHGDARTMLSSAGEPIVFAEWGYLGKGRFQRRDFRLDTLTQMSSFGADTLFADLGKHEIFVPVKNYPPLSVAELADG